MDDKIEAVFRTVKDHDKSTELMDRLAAAARPGAVFSEPVTSGDHTVITASEVVLGMGVGYGAGAGSMSQHDEAIDAAGEQGAGGGAGGGGMSMGRPVAVISVGPRGVQVEPIVDASKVAITFLTALSAMVVALTRMRRSRG